MLVVCTKDARLRLLAGFVHGKLKAPTPKNEGWGTRNSKQQKIYDAAVIILRAMV